MSLFVEWVNQIKAQATDDWLTDAQRNVYEMIVGRWANSPFVCLCGPPGCGKTFIARLLVQHNGYRYTHNLEAVEAGRYQVILDDAVYTRMMRTTSSLLGLQRVIIVCQDPPKDPMPHAVVALTGRDVAQFRHNLTQHGILPSFLTHTEGVDLGLILRAEAIQRGKHNVVR